MPFFKENSGKKSRYKLDDSFVVLHRQREQRNYNGKKSVNSSIPQRTLFLVFLIGALFGLLIGAISLAIQLPPESIDALFLNLN